VRRPAISVLALLAALLLAASGAGEPDALASPSDAQATSAYVHADYQLAARASSSVGTGEAVIEAVLERTRSECPLAAAGSPQDPQSTQMSDEVIGAMVTTALHHELPAIRAFLSAVAPLRWSSRGLTAAVRSYAAKLRTLSSLREPHLCADVRSWAAAGFAALPAPTVAFDARFMPSWVAIGELPGGLSRFEGPESRAVAGRASGLQEGLAEFEAREVEQWGHIMNALELWP